MVDRIEKQNNGMPIDRDFMELINIPDKSDVPATEMKKVEILTSLYFGFPMEQIL